MTWRHHLWAVLLVCVFAVAVILASGIEPESSSFDAAAAACGPAGPGACGAEVAAADGGAGGGAPGCGCGALKRSDFGQGVAAAGAREAADVAVGAKVVGAGETEEQAGAIFLEGGRFLMGLVPADEADPTISPMDAEGPAREVEVAAFGLGAFEVSNRRFARFVESTGFVTESETFGWSFGVEAFISAEVNASITSQVANAPWWLPVNGADWRHPNGPDTSIDDIMDHPVTQVSLRDAETFCRWSRPDGRLPMEVEWEFAARGGKQQRRFPWGQSMLTGKRKDTHRMNIWQSELDAKLQEDGPVRNLYSYGERSLDLVKEFYGARNTGLDGHPGTAPVDAYGPQNGFGFYNMVGNVWEWTSTQWEVKDPRAPPVDANTMVKKGGSFLCNPATCNRFRSSARMIFTADSAASNVGFRCAYSGRRADR